MVYFYNTEKITVLKIYTPLFHALFHVFSIAIILGETPSENKYKPPTTPLPAISSKWSSLSSLHNRD